MSDYTPRCGDVVHHEPSGEDWVVAWADKTHLAPTGWPPCLAEIKDCKVIRKCTDEEHKIEVQNWLDTTAKDDDGRRAKIKELYGKVVE